MGGTGTHSESDLPPEELPERYESGNLNVPGILGLAAGIAYLRSRGVAAVAQHERALIAQLLTALEALDHVTVYGPRNVDERVAVVSLNVDQLDPQEVATLLDQVGQIQTRADFAVRPLACTKR